MDFDRTLVRIEIEKVLHLLVKRTQEIEQRSLLEYYHELFVDLQSFIEPICQHGSVAHLMVMLPERLRDIQKEMGADLSLDPEFIKLLHL